MAEVDPSIISALRLCLLVRALLGSLLRPPPPKSISPPKNVQTCRKGIGEKEGRGRARDHRGATVGLNDLGSDDSSSDESEASSSNSSSKIASKRKRLLDDDDDGGGGGGGGDLDAGYDTDSEEQGSSASDDTRDDEDEPGVQMTVEEALHNSQYTPSIQPYLEAASFAHTSP